MRKSAMAAALGLLAVVLITPVVAAEFEVHMLNKGDAGTMVFEPMLTRIAVGDTVKFVPTDKGHNAEIIAGFLPEGAEPFKGKIGEEISVTFTVPGVYGVKCLPHFAMGMVALIAVGDELPNLDAAKAISTPTKAKARFDTAFEELAAQ